jgi:histidinol-phosphate/aromatic aminotransferase/cobyric acid decarboxylase-like protein
MAIANANQPALKAGVGVYAYYFPEVRREISRIAGKYPHDVFLRSITPGLDNFHQQMIARYVKKFEPQVSGLSEFAHQYPTAGSSEAIYHQLVKIKLTDPRAPIYVLNGEYQGYSEYAKTLGMAVTVINGPGEAKEKGYWFISNPSARDGNLLPPDFVQKICEAGHKVILDLSYVGIAKPANIPVQHPNIIAVLTSLSKPFGLFYYRVGFAFSREPIDSLFPNQWFKSVFSLIVADKVLEKFAPDKLAKKYRKWQEKALAGMRKETGLPLLASDVVLLATLDKTVPLSPAQEALAAEYRRGDGYRFCLTPYFLEMEKAGREAS